MIILLIILPLISCLVSFFMSNPQILFFSAVVYAIITVLFGYLGNKNCVGGNEGGLGFGILSIYFTLWTFSFFIIFSIWKFLGG